MLRKVLIAAAILAGAGVLLLVALLGVALYVLFNTDWEWNMIPQDCGGVTFSVKGFIINEKETPIEGAEIHVFNTGSYELPPFNVIVVSDELGYFETQNVSGFACTPFDVEISAPGYQDQKLTFYPPAEQWPDELPEILTVALRTNDSTQDLVNP